jgi:hypothetical protein
MLRRFLTGDKTVVDGCSVKDKRLLIFAVAILTYSFLQASEDLVKCFDLISRKVAVISYGCLKIAYLVM